MSLSEFGVLFGRSSRESTRDETFTSSVPSPFRSLNGLWCVSLNVTSTLGRSLQSTVSEAEVVTRWDGESFERGHRTTLKFDGTLYK